MLRLWCRKHTGRNCIPSVERIGGILILNVPPVFYLLEAIGVKIAVAFRVLFAFLLPNLLKLI